MLKSGSQFAGTVDATAIDHHDHLFLGGAKGVHHLMDILTEFVGIEMGHDLIEDARGTVLYGADDIEQYPAGDATPAAVLLPGLTFEAFLGVDLALAQRTGGQAVTLAASPSPASGQGKALKHRLILVEQNDLTLTRPICQGLEFKAAIGQICRVGIEPAGRATVAQRVFLVALHLTVV